MMHCYLISDKALNDMMKIIVGRVELRNHLVSSVCCLANRICNQKTMKQTQGDRNIYMKIKLRSEDKGA